MLKNDVLLKRIAKLVSMAYATTDDVVYQRFMELNSIDLTIDELQQPEPRYGKNE